MDQVDSMRTLAARVYLLSSLGNDGDRFSARRLLIFGSSALSNLMCSIRIYLNRMAAW